MVVLTVAGVARPGDALVGDVLTTVTLPPGAHCEESSGTAIAVVPGGKLGFPKIPTLLVTSCVRGGQAKLFFLDPSTSPTTLIKALDTSVTPSAGWESLALRSDRADLIGCGMVSGSPSIYAIDFNAIAPNTVVDGTATLLFTGPAGSTCRGLAWDVTSNPKSIYLTSAGAAVLHLAEHGAPIAGDLPPGCAGGMAGVAVGVASTAASEEAPPFSGSVLLVACGEDGEASEAAAIRQIAKADGGLIGSLESPTPLPGDIECDPMTFALSQAWHPTIRSKDVLWVKDADPLSPTPHRVYAVELPFAACGPVPPPPTSESLACPTGDLDTDGDGLPDCWEDGRYWADGLPGIALDGIYTSPGRADTSQRLTLCVDANGANGFDPGECATPLRRDIFVEIDHMEFHRPDPLALGDVVTAFGNAPAFAQDSGKCDPGGCTPGIRLHVQVDEQIPHVTRTALSPCTGPLAAGDVDFDAIKSGTAFVPAVGGFGTATERANANGLNAKRLAFHYALFVHNQSPTPPSAVNSSSGCAELFGNDFMVSLGSWTPPNPSIAGHSGGVGSRSEQAGTFMHELGHNLGLRHGGIDNVNCKPHHVSVMNYVYQFPNTVSDRPLNYSPLALGVAAPLHCSVPEVTGIGLNEACLDESRGVGSGYTGRIAYGPLAGVPPKPTLVTAGGPINWDKDATASERSVSRDLSIMTSSTGGCPASPGEFLEGSNDWALIQLNLRASTDFADGVSLNFDPAPQGGTHEAKLEDALDLSLDLIDVQPFDPKNTINVRSAANIHVAIFSRDGIDATRLDPATVTLRGAPTETWVLTVRENQHCKTRDVNKDGRADLLCYFKLPKGTPVTPGTQRVVLEAATFDGSYYFRGSDSVRFVH
jgi:hypothetical protein